MLTKFFSLTLIILPFVVWRGYYEGPKVFVFLIIGFFLAIFWIYKSLVNKQLMIFNKSDIFYILWLLVMVISSVFGVHPLESIIGGSYRHQGILFFFTLWLIHKTVHLFNNQEKIFLGKGIGIAVLAEALISFADSLGTIGEKNAVAGFIGIGLYFLIQYFPLVYLVIPFLAVFITKSRAGILSLLPSLVLKKQNLLIVLIIILTIIISLSNISSPFENRFLIWKLGTESILQKPFLGFGAESGEVIYNSAFAKNNMLLKDLIIDRAHNLFLDILMWSGGIGLMFFVGFLADFFKSLKNKYQKLAFSSFLIYSFFQPLSIVHWLLFFLL